MERFDDGDDEEIAPDDPDWDLSEAHGYMWEPAREQWPVPSWVLLWVSVVVVIALLAPGLYFIFRYG